MVFAELKNHYEVLDLTPDASATDIRNAYLRAKSAFQRDSAALYSIVGESEREEILVRVEQAYKVLSDLNLRKEYDRSFENLQNGNSNIVSIDRTPPMEMGSDTADLLIAPKTDDSAGDFFSNAVAANPAPAEPAPEASAPKVAAAPPTQPPTAANHPTHSSSGIEQEILEQTDWSGSFLRRVRESRVLSYEEITRETRIPKNYIIALEEEDFEKLPAPVYIRGFITQLARLLKLPINPVIQSYMTRLKDTFPEKFR